MNNTVLEIDINKFINNINKIKEIVQNKEIMPIIKANGYGTYINKRLDVINNFNIVAVAKVEEAIFLRELGYEKDIFILNQPSILELDEINKYNLIIGLSEKDFLENINIPIRIHLEIETGMNRTGIKLKDLDYFINKIKNNSNIQVEGVYTHLSCADTNRDYTEEQLVKFREAVQIVKDNFNIKYIHSSASNGLLFYDDQVSNLIRPGIIMYGYYPCDEAKEKIELEPIATLKTKITYLKDLDKDEKVSYGAKFVSSTNMKVATIPIGYADGYKRSLSNEAEVIVKGQKCKVLGTICMDSCMIDVTNVDCKVGDTVYIWDNKLVTVEDLAQISNTINYEIISTISPRVKRVFIENK